MSKGLAGVKTLTVKQIADKWKLPLAVVAKKIAAGVKVEKEHTTSLRQANEIARDHLGERPDYYDKLHKMEKSKIKLNELGEYDNKGGSPGYEATSEPIRAVRKRDVKEQSPANPSYKERPLYERGKVPADMTDATARGVYEMDTSRMPMSKNIEDIRSTTGKDWKSRVMTASTYVSGAIGAVKNAINGPPKPDMTRLSPKDSLPAERPAWTPDGGTSTPQVKVSNKRGYEPKFTSSQITSLTPSSKDAESSKTRGNALDMSPKYQGKTPSSTSGSTTQAATMERPGSQTKESDYYTPPGASVFAKNMKEGRIDEISAELVGKVSNARFWRGEAPSKTLTRAINKKFIESGKKKEPKKQVKEEDNTKPDVNLMGNQKPDAYGYGAKGTTKTIYEETKMDNKELINEALDCILEENLPEMKDNLMKALQEKAIEKLEERKKEIAANYFAQ